MTIFSSYQAYYLLGLVVLSLLLRPVLVYIRDPLGLRKYPAPSWFAALTPLWLVHATWSQNRSRIIHREFQRLGDVIRVSPDHIIFNDPAAVKDIYGVLANSQGVHKDAFYDRVANDSHDLVQLRDRGEHASRRKAIANAFAAKTVVNMESVIRQHFHELLVRIDQEIQKPVTEKVPFLNLRLWFNYFTLDVIGDMGFGRPMGFLKSMSDRTEAETQDGKSYQVMSMIDSLHKGVRYGLSIGNIPSHRLIHFLKHVVDIFPPLAARLGSTGGSDFEDICIRKLRTRLLEGAPTRWSGDFMKYILEDTKRSTEGNSFSHKQFRSLVADTMMMMNAGSDTTASALTSTTWYLLRHPQALTRLRKELSDHIGRAQTSGLSAEESIFAYDVVKDLPFLRACIDESLRLRSPLAYQLPRLVSRPTVIAGHQIMPGTVVAAAPYSIHRHASLFRDPDEYQPERWVDFDEEFPNQIEDLKRYNIVFSQGSRACIGRHLAIIELQILIPTLVMRYDMELEQESKTELKVFERFNSNPGPLLVTSTLTIRDLQIPVNIVLVNLGVFQNLQQPKLYDSSMAKRFALSHST
ncbi:hypothetical protein CNMCM6106_006181 [Aspergillus hiratsukae]|uniref:Cytochrome P450 n=1 Tax=Aspergillus hiratsukae TaxID=1194566 RepID=A0A8H6QFQ8_9EURO|nr:hypothetical protein CNMCM6106_006181 [Aspergillus hiratsukae]